MWLDGQALSGGILYGIGNPIYGCRVRITPGINPIYAMLEMSYPRDSKIVSYVDVGLVQTCLDLNESYGCGCGVVGGVGRLSKNLVKPWA